MLQAWAGKQRGWKLQGSCRHEASKCAQKHQCPEGSPKCTAALQYLCFLLLSELIYHILPYATPMANLFSLIATCFLKDICKAIPPGCLHKVSKSQTLLHQSSGRNRRDAVFILNTNPNQHKLLWSYQSYLQMHLLSRMHLPQQW